MPKQDITHVNPTKGKLEMLLGRGLAIGGVLTLLGSAVGLGVDAMGTSYTENFDLLNSLKENYRGLFYTSVALFGGGILFEGFGRMHHWYYKD